MKTRILKPIIIMLMLVLTFSSVTPMAFAEQVKSDEILVEAKKVVSNLEANFKVSDFDDLILFSMANLQFMF